MHTQGLALGIGRPSTGLIGLRARPRATVAKGVNAAGRRCVMATFVADKDAPSPASAKGALGNQLEALKGMSKVVADTGDVDAVRKYQPVDCTTNPSLVLKAVQMPEYKHFLEEAIAEEKADPGPKIAGRPYAGIADRLAVNMGCELLKIVPGRVSTEVDAHLSYDTEATISKALRLVDLYAKKGIGPERLYIKIASTWEGIRACEKLQKQGVDCNMTLLFSFAQAVACANASAALISPFVGRILDWYKKSEGRDFSPEEDPGVGSVQRIYKYYKAYKIATIVMAASFRNAGEIRELAGCDNITIAPSLLEELRSSTDELPRKLWPEMGGCDDEQLSNLNEKQFREMHGADKMASDKLPEGIDKFAEDQMKLENMLAAIGG